MFSQGLVTLPRLWSPTLQCLILWSKHGPSSTCSRPSVPRSHGPAAGTPGTQVPVHTNVHVCITAAHQALVLGFAWLCEKFNATLFYVLLIERYMVYSHLICFFLRPLCGVWQKKWVIQLDGACECNYTCHRILGVSVIYCFVAIAYVKRCLRVLVSVPVDCFTLFCSVR